MDLIISGMALSCQWWPSLKHFENSLAGGEKPLTSLVEHPGEVILQTLNETEILPDSCLTLVYDPARVDLSETLPLLESMFDQVNLVEPVSAMPGERLRQAEGLIGDNPDHHIIICDTSPYGSTALLLSHPDHPGAAYARIHVPGDAGVNPARADYILLPGSPLLTDRDLIDHLKGLFSTREDSHPVALGCSDAAGSLSLEFLSLVQAALVVRLGLIPAWSPPDLSTETNPGADTLYFNREFRPWLSRGQDFKRVALQVFRSPAKKPDIFILEEAGSPAGMSVRLREGSDPTLFPLSGANSAELLEKLDLLESRLQGTDSLESIACSVYTNYLEGKKAYTCTLLARNREEIHKELAHARSGITRAFQSGKAWNSPGGSCFTPQPLGQAGIALVYPGAFNSYPGIGREMFFSFPGLSDAAREWIPDLSHSLAEEFLYLRSSRSPSVSSETIMADFFQHPGQLIESGISLSVLYTQILTRLFAIKIDAALGYSLGEVSMLWANRVWQNAGESSESWMESNLFKDQLFGEMKAVRDYWKDRDLPEDFWDSYILKADKTRVQELCDREPMVFLSIVNTSGEVVIAGERTACKRVIQNLDCHAISMPFNAVIHNPTMQKTRAAFRELYTHPTHPVSGIRFFSAANYQQLTLTESSLANNMAAMTTSPIDFPRIVNTAYSSGVRIFIEVGPQKTCSRWIEAILKDQPHAAIPINKKYQPDLAGVLKVLSLLVCHGVDVNLEPLYPALKKPGPDRKVPANPENGRSASIPLQQEAVPGREMSAQGLEGLYLENLARVSADMSQSHQVYLRKQRILTRNLARLMEIQAGSLPRATRPDLNTSPLYSRSQIEAFTRGDHRDCFGDTFSEFGGRRIPRLPNGDLQFIDRVTAVQGFRERVEKGSQLVSEFDLPERTWYRDGAAAPLPHIALMELALQPCGFLSAWMGSIKGRGSQDLYFRNLDGEGTLLAWPEHPGRTITNQVTLLSSSSLEDVIIQKYSFQLFWGGQPFYRGTSSFGYFPLPMLDSQAGLDGHQQSHTWYEAHPKTGTWITIPSRPDPGPTHPRLPGIDSLWISPRGGLYSNGAVYFTHELSAENWFYQAHFYQDPVMPGSLGVETITRGLMAAAPTWGIPSDLHWRIKPGVKMVWKYRGQITPDVSQIRIEIHPESITRTSSGWEICADGFLWKGSIKIYQIENLALQSC